MKLFTIEEKCDRRKPTGIKEVVKMKKLTRSMTNRKFLGVCGGIAEYFNVDPTVVRLLFVVFGLAGGSALLLYIVGALIMPEEYKTEVYKTTNE